MLITFIYFFNNMIGLRGPPGLTGDKGERGMIGAQGKIITINLYTIQCTIGPRVAKSWEQNIFSLFPTKLNIYGMVFKSSFL